nr:MAG TPA: hypothetical protein [Caudoviricetes sp.]
MTFNHCSTRNGCNLLDCRTCFKLVRLFSIFFISILI